MRPDSRKMIVITSRRHAPIIIVVAMGNIATTCIQSIKSSIICIRIVLRSDPSSPVLVYDNEATHFCESNSSSLCSPGFEHTPHKIKKYPFSQIHPHHSAIGNYLWINTESDKLINEQSSSIL